MRPLNKIELDFVTRCPFILEEEIVRPKSYRSSTFAERIENGFIELEPYFDNIYVGKNEELIKTAFWFVYVGHAEKEMTNEEILMYVCSNCKFKHIKKYTSDIQKIINYVNC